MDSITERHLAQFGIGYYLNKAIEEVIELKDAVINGDYKEQVSELGDTINCIRKIQAYIQCVHNVDDTKIDLDIENVIETKNERVDERLKTDYFNKIENMNHDYVDIGQLSPKHRDIVMHVLKLCQGVSHDKSVD